MMYTISLKNLTSHDVSIVGGKGAALGKMIQAGFPVPDGFVVTTKAFKEFHDHNLSSSFVEETSSAFEALHCEKVAVRSSAIAEDSHTASWAGQLESYLNITKENLSENIKKCWTSINSLRAKHYTKLHKVEKEDLAVAVVVQKMINSEAAGVVFTKNPVTNAHNEIVIDSCFGLGELLVKGAVTPDSFIISKDSLEIINYFPNEQKFMIVYQDSKQKQIDLPNKYINQSSLTKSQVKELAKIAMNIEQFFGAPQDIEWAYEDGKFFIVQSRPVTTN